MTHLTGFTDSLGPASRDVDALQEYVRHGPVRQALEGAGANDLVCAAGSIFVIAEVMEFFGQGRG